ncbi:MAG TPA: hypothetical protein DCR35_02420 [Runella sp.]|nr:hypothetical protein [Runella sp.]HAO48249.1 hypothetical protein [Runella sp.]
MIRTKSIISLFLLIATSCSVFQDIGPSKYSWGSFSAKINGKVWGESYSGGFQEIRGDTFQGGNAENQCPEESHSISFDWFNKQGFHRENLILRKIPLLSGKHQVIPNPSKCKMTDPIYAMFYTSTDDGDVLGDIYTILPTQDNFVQIDNYDNYTKEIKGKFQLTFVIKSIGGNHVLPDTLRLTEGRFHTKIK